MTHRTRTAAVFALVALAGCSDEGIVDLNETEAQVVARGAAVYPAVIPLPAGFSPEGIVVGHGHDVYAGSLADGSIVKGDLRTGEIETLVTGQAGRLAVGMAFDDRSDGLFVVGGFEPVLRVYDGDTGELRGTFAAPGGAFLNDVIVTRDAAYVTDSFVPFIYRLPLGPRGALPTGTDLEPLPLTGDFVSIPGQFNANGIEASADGKHLVIVNSATGELYRVDPMSGVATAIDLGGDLVASGDGIVLAGRTLYVVQNFFNKIAVITLAPDLLSGTVDREITSPAFRIPTTADVFGNALYAVNARFDVAPPGVPNAFDFEIVRVER